MKTPNIRTPHLVLGFLLNQDLFYDQKNIMITKHALFQSFHGQLDHQVGHQRPEKGSLVIRDE